ncbi:MAG TPA: 4Fe-4S binding protein [Clostridia bacterium]|nr:4Fe-4S binding protein [Clostridia bacterium]
MMLKKRNIVQFILFFIVVFLAVTYALYINDWIPFKLLSFGDLNPYGGWSALKSAFTAVDYQLTGLSRSIALTVSILVTTLFFGRFFCGFICPLGALQDFFAFIGNKLNIKKIKLNNERHEKLLFIKYFIFLFAVVVSIMGLGPIISSYSPWLAFLDISMGFILTPGLYILIGLMISSLIIPRLFCRYLCPLGAFQSLINAFGFFKVKSSDHCNGCTNCLKECPMAIKKPYASGEVSPECISCLNCVERKCIRGDYSYTLNILNKKIKPNQYIALALIVFISIYFLIPFIHITSNTQGFLSFTQLQEGRYIGTGIGFGGPIRVEIVVDNERIKTINVLSHQESTGYYEEVFKMKSREIIATQSLNVDTLSGATASSRGYLSAIKSAINQSLEQE